MLQLRHGARAEVKKVRDERIIRGGSTGPLGTSAKNPGVEARAGVAWPGNADRGTLARRPVSAWTSAAAVLAIVLTVATAWAGDEKLSPELKSLNAGPDVEVIVQYKTAPAESQYEKAVALGG